MNWDESALAPGVDFQEFTGTGAVLPVFTVQEQEGSRARNPPLTSTGRQPESHTKFPESPETSKISRSCSKNNGHIIFHRETELFVDDVTEIAWHTWLVPDLNPIPETALFAQPS